MTHVVMSPISYQSESFAFESIEQDEHKDDAGKTVVSLHSESRPFLVQICIELSAIQRINYVPKK